ncbi:hypothetical protein FBUS_06396 [Fasciolopsis buskii]|uniref:Uncharacterized protein n=1 Tax=Fasciolopsis buskii TaxID=27845 RepID=A0A8E0RVB1_9TREM|nr:hypothetical protein FBUS_06396 [Fasciolopsis buski]
MCHPEPTVVQSIPSSPHGFHASNVWHMPAAIIRLDKIDKTKFSSHWPAPITTFFMSAEGIGLLVPNTSVVGPFRNGHFGSYAHHPLLLASEQDLIYFVDPETGRPVDRIHLESDEHVIHYRIHDCSVWTLDTTNFSDSSSKHPVLSAYATQLVDSFGRQLSDWSIARLLSPGGSGPLSSSVCGGSLTISRPLYGSFRSRIYLLVVDLKTGMIRAPSSGSSPVYHLTATAMLNVETLWPQLITMWTYLPVLYLVIGFAIVHVSRMSIEQSAKSFLRHGAKLSNSA